jgi:hypothetical protein
VLHIIGLSGYWRNHTPYLQILLQSLYQVIKKASDFEWGPQQEHNFKVVKELITTHSQLYTIACTDTMILDISYQAGYGNWSIMYKWVAHTVPISFYCKRFPYVESKYTIFERLTWTLMEVMKTVCLVLMDRCLIIHSPVPILDWINMKGEALAGNPSEPKMLQWSGSSLSSPIIIRSWQRGRLHSGWGDCLSPNGIMPHNHSKNYTGQEYQPLEDREMGQLTNKCLVHWWFIHVVEWQAALQICSLETHGWATPHRPRHG